MFKEREGGDNGEVERQVGEGLLATGRDHHHLNQRQGGGATLFSRFTHHDAEALEPPVESLDQLYAQAVGVQPLLKYKVQAWAHATNGLFFVRPDPNAPRGAAKNEFRSWRDLCSDPQADNVIKWGTLKSAERAIEKLVRSYEGKCGRLLDVCRQSIAFTSLQDLANCLEVIADDEQVAIISVKNRMSHNYDAKTHSLGYRDVNINLRFTSPLAQRLCVHLHICEVQLLLTPFAKLKSSAGHKRYVAFRNARGK